MKISSTCLTFALKWEAWSSPRAGYLGPTASLNVMFNISFCLAVSGFGIKSLGSWENYCCVYKSEGLKTVNVKATMSCDIKPNTARTKMLSPFSLLTCDLVYSVVAVSIRTEVCAKQQRSSAEYKNSDQNNFIYLDLGVLLFNGCMSTDESVIIQKLLHVKGNYSSIGVIHQMLNDMNGPRSWICKE